MEVVSHYHVGVHGPTETFRRFPQGAFKCLSSSLPRKNWSAVITPVYDVITRTGKLDSKGSRHWAFDAAEVEIVKSQDLTSYDRPQIALKARLNPSAAPFPQKMGER